MSSKLILAGAEFKLSKLLPANEAVRLLGERVGPRLAIPLLTKHIRNEELPAFDLCIRERDGSRPRDLVIDPAAGSFVRNAGGSPTWPDFRRL